MIQTLEKGKNIIKRTGCNNTLNMNWREGEELRGRNGGWRVVDSKGGARAHLYEYRITPYFIFACIVGSMGGSLFGYDLGVSGGVTSMDDFLKEFFPGIYRRKQEHLQETDYCKYDNQILTLFTSSLYLAALVSTFGASYVTRNKGRRASIIFGSISFFIGAILNAAAQNIAMLIIGRIFLGFGIGFGNQAVPLYLSEMAPSKIRGAVNQLFQLTTCLGILVANFVNYGVERIHPWGWRLSLGLAAVPAILMFIGGLFLPETPNSLVEQGRLDEARQILEKVRGTPKVEAEFQDLVDASNAAQAIKHPFRNLLKRKIDPNCLGFGAGAALYSSAITSAALVLATFISMAFVDKFGRRAFFLEAGCEMILCSVAIAITLALKFGQGEMLPKGIGIFLVVVICIFVLAYGRSWGPLGWLVPSELFPLETRSAGQSMVVCVNMIFTALIAQCFLAALCHLKYGIFLLFAGLIFIMSSFIFFLLPETKQVPIEEIHLLWQNHWFWKRYCGPDLKSQELQLQKKTDHQV
ncbi:UNVERIFIED_CONTAM: Sugar transport protein 14 [Sesamum calycinum]|uniref:Sugar transport protein 14 n=1 Tax=Sesamum calycinum TaxID=2727403 RepID=A0AAW2NRX0_9LAMI